MNRIYNGCPDDELKAKWLYEEGLSKALSLLEPDAHCAYFPMEAQYRVHKWGVPISKMCNTREEALLEAINVLNTAKSGDTQ